MIAVRQAGAGDHQALRACIHEVFVETSGQKAPEFGRELWEWQYLRTPQESVLVVAEDLDTGIICGYFHALVLRVRLDGREMSAAMVQDVGTLAGFRNQGVFRDMGTAALDLFRLRGIELVYTFPNERSRPSFERNHHYARIGRVPIRVSPLAPGRVVGTIMGLRTQPVVSWTLAGPGRAIRRRAARLPDGIEIRREHAIDERIAAVADAYGKRARFALIRDAEYLRWRYLHKPQAGYSCWTARQREAPVAFLVTRSTDLFGSRCVVLMDLGCTPGHETALDALIGARLFADREAAVAVTMGTHPLLRRLWRHGFVRLPERVNPRPFNLLAKTLDGSHAISRSTPADWLITLGDWDVL